MPDELPLGIWETLMGYHYVYDTFEDAWADVHYAVYDIDGNGTQELLLADGNGSLINVYTLDKKGNLVKLVEGWSRNAYFLLENGRIYNFGSNGASSHQEGVYRIGDDGVTLETICCYDIEGEIAADEWEDEVLHFYQRTGDNRTEITEAEEDAGMKDAMAGAEFLKMEYDDLENYLFGK